MVGGSLHEEVARGSLDAGPLVGSDRVGQVLSLLRCLGFDFDENDGVTVGSDQIDLTDG